MRRRPQIFRNHLSFLSLSETQCIQKFCLNRQTITDICQLLQANLEGDMPRAYSLPVELRVLVALTFYATGSFQYTVDYCKATYICVNCIMCSVRCTCSCSKAGRRIHPSISHELQQNTKQGFLGRYGFPGLLGAIDCTHVQLDAPTQDRHLSINRRGTYSVHVQEVCIFRRPF
ncbi:HARB1 nuclease, partial [Polyodon spathula]|nr:HARB1 nuclease [Polyodon spathula]